LVISVTANRSDEDENDNGEEFMPILIMALVALLVFLIMGGLCLMAVTLESRNARRLAAGVVLPEETAEAPLPEAEKPKARAAHA